MKQNPSEGGAAVFPGEKPDILQKETTERVPEQEIPKELEEVLRNEAKELEIQAEGVGPAGKKEREEGGFSKKAFAIVAAGLTILALNLGSMNKAEARGGHRGQPAQVLVVNQPHRGGHFAHHRHSGGGAFLAGVGVGVILDRVLTQPSFVIPPLVNQQEIQMRDSRLFQIQNRLQQIYQEELAATSEYKAGRIDQARYNYLLSIYSREKTNLTQEMNLLRRY
jgi:hypothetical protein